MGAMPVADLQGVDRIVGLEFGEVLSHAILCLCLHSVCRV